MLPLFDRPEVQLGDNEPETHLPHMPLGEHVIHDYRSLGLSLKAHPVAFLRHHLDRAGITPNARLGDVADGRRVSVAGLVLVRQRPGKGNAIFLTLEDEHSIANIVVWARVFERFRPVIMGSKFIRVTGKLQKESGVIHIVADKMEDWTHWLATMSEELQATADQGDRPVAEGRASAANKAARDPRMLQSYETLARKTSSVMPKGRNFQ
jgi:error-prone DNA polymerase